MFSSVFHRQFYFYYILIIIGTSIATAILATQTTQEFYYRETIKRLSAEASLIRERVGLLSSYELKEIDSLCKTLAELTATRITIITASGIVLGDSVYSPQEMNKDIERPEIQKALSENQLTSTVRLSDTMQTNMLYVVLPWWVEGQLYGVIRTSVKTQVIEETIRSTQSLIFMGVILVILLAIVISWRISRRVTQPLEEMAKGVELFTQGNYGYQIKVPLIHELRLLSGSLNRMIEHIKQRFSGLYQRLDEQESAFSSMLEGVFIIDLNEKIVRINHAAGKMFDVNPQLILGKLLEETIRNEELSNLVQEVLSTHQAIEKEIILHRNVDEYYLQVHGTALLDQKSGLIGVLVVLNDITQLRRLENIRKDFVANVSHELKTPITSIKGAIETLVDGDAMEQQDVDAFLRIIHRQSDRLHTIIEDLLTLAKIEQEELERIEVELQDVNYLLSTVVQQCTPGAEMQEVSIEVNYEGSIYSKFNSRLMEQALTNLTDNAIKYSNPGSRVQLSVHQTDTETIFLVTDNGVGIAVEHLPRLFERFYRVDKSRSRKIGGTGLGLAIVKHIAKAHDGYVTVDSQISQGSCFRIHLPRRYRNTRSSQ